MVGLVAQLTFGFVESDSILITLSLECELLVCHFLLGSFFRDPLSFEHGSLLICQFSFFLTLELASVFLPVQNGHSVLNIDALLVLLLQLAFKLGLGIELP